MPAVVGGGLTAAATCSLLPDRSSLEVTVWDKARGAGGRMSTARTATVDGCTADLGAQYITRHKEFQPQNQ